MKTRNIFLILIFLISTLQSFACSCGTPFLERFDEDSKYASAIFLGQVTELGSRISVTSNGDTISTSAKIKVMKMWKGVDTSDYILINCGYLISTCDHSFIKGEYVLLFAYGTDMNNLRISMCSRTSTLIYNAKKKLTKEYRKVPFEDIKKLDKIYAANLMNNRHNQIIDPNFKK